MERRDRGRRAALPLKNSYGCAIGAKWASNQARLRWSGLQNFCFFPWVRGVKALPHLEYAQTQILAS